MKNFKKIFVILGLLLICFVGLAKADTPISQVRASHILVDNYFQAEQIRNDIIKGTAPFEYYAKMRLLFYNIEQWLIQIYHQ